MAKSVPPPTASKHVFTVMRQYCNQQQYCFRDGELELIAETFYQHYESLDWRSGKKQIPFWPAAAKKWVINEVKRDHKRLPLFAKSWEKKTNKAGEAGASEETSRERIRKAVEAERESSSPKD